MNDSFICVLLLASIVYLIPTIIAFWRWHHYKWVICGINVVFGFTGIGYLAAFVWAVWPKQTAFFDVVANDPTTNSPEAGQKIYRQMGANARAFSEASFVPSPQLATEQRAQMPSFCSNCGKPLPSGVHFCPSCSMAVSG